MQPYAECYVEHCFSPVLVGPAHLAHFLHVMVYNIEGLVLVNCPWGDVYVALIWWLSFTTSKFACLSGFLLMVVDMFF